MSRDEKWIFLVNELTAFIDLQTNLSHNAEEKETHFIY